MRLQIVTDNKIRLFGIGLLLAAISLAAVLMIDSDDSAGATEIVQTENQRFIEEHPEIVHDHPPLVCEGGVPTLGCSEAYYHKDELERRDWHVKQAWIESIMECGTQTDVLHTDDRYPVGHRIVTYKDCNEDEFIRPTPTAGPSREVE